ncbi:hypothetical protein TEQG_01800 [Trichophyton equinum CBS 127.97]|uniref:Uncharacterized protein n=1 Tax=Trichophyton equinum (strain ATCC MYA-4606 / CBS 127.97) TaxID=559882 RepID=F2PLJ5_TRIEC|nr:hypothetical protein TEQG_01800 [Trichophyton equinum CBS 127.97]
MAGGGNKGKSRDRVAVAAAARSGQVTLLLAGGELAVATHWVSYCPRTAFRRSAEREKREKEGRKRFAAEDADDEVDIQLATARAADLVLAGAPKDVYYGQRWMLQETAGRSPASKWPTGRFTSDHLRAVCLKYGGSTSSPRI